MTTIENIMALANAYAESYRDALAPNVNALVDEAQTALRTALTEALAAQPVREPLQDALAWEIWLNAVDTANNTGRLVAYTYKESIERAHNIRGDK